MWLGCIKPIGFDGTVPFTELNNDGLGFGEFLTLNREKSKRCTQNYRQIDITKVIQAHRF